MMPHISVNLEGANAWPDVREKLARDLVIHYMGEIKITALPAGMQSGKASVALRFDLDDGRVLIAETSLALFLTAADMLKARFGDPRNE